MLTMEEIELKLTVNEVNQILEALGQLPYAQVYQLIHQVQEQAQQQIHAKKKTASAPAADGAIPTSLNESLPIKGE